MSGNGSIVGGTVLDLTRPPWAAKFRPVEPARGVAPVPERRPAHVLVTGDPERPGQVIAHRAGRFSDDPAPCGGGHGYLAQADDYDGRWCQHPQCTGFRWWGA